MKSWAGHLNRNAEPLRIGFVPLCDCAPIAVAQEFGFFEKHGLTVNLSREVGWATIRDKIIYGELDAAHALAPMIFAATLGVGSIPAACVTGLVLSVDGNAITLSQSLWEAGVRDGASLAVHARSRREPLIFGVPFLYSSHFILLNLWLRTHGLQPERDVRFAVVPPSQMAAHLKAGHLDGFCVGEPWNSVAIFAGSGWRVAASADVAAGHPEKVLMVRREFAESRADEHERLIRALVEACQFCHAPENRERIVELLARRDYVNVARPILREGFEASPGEFLSDGQPYEPSVARAAWVMEHMADSGLLTAHDAIRRGGVGARIFRPDLFQSAIAHQLTA
jgi:ABC-type nitrate/sulfonate/bicarbonate transport system substrate-binding protein